MNQTGTNDVGADRSVDLQPTARALQLSHSQKLLVIAVVVCYAIGYPVALAVNGAVGWSLVTLGGIFLLALGIVTVRQVHRGSRET